MGYIRHDAVLVVVSDYALHATESDQKRWGFGDVVADVAAFRESLPEKWRPLVVGPIAGVVNGDASYVFLPDGSKEGWTDSDNGNEYRRQFVALFTFAHGDGSSPFDVTAVTFGGDDADRVDVAVHSPKVGGTEAYPDPATVALADLTAA